MNRELNEKTRIIAAGVRRSEGLFVAVFELMRAEGPPEGNRNVSPLLLLAWAESRGVLVKITSAGGRTAYTPPSHELGLAEAAPKKLIPGTRGNNRNPGIAGTLSNSAPFGLGSC